MREITSNVSLRKNSVVYLKKIGVLDAELHGLLVGLEYVEYRPLELVIISRVPVNSLVLDGHNIIEELQDRVQVQVFLNGKILEVHTQVRKCTGKMPWVVVT
jgi:hypothetical protein